MEQSDAGPVPQPPPPGPSHPPAPRGPEPRASRPKGTGRVPVLPPATPDPEGLPPVGMVWAQDHGGVLGSAEGMLWRVPADFRHFKAVTLGGGLVMGRTTWDSLRGALVGRRNVVMTRSEDWTAPGAHRASSLEQALALAADGLEEELGADPRTGRAASWPRTWVMGGGSVYRQAMEAGVADLLVVSTIDLNVAAGLGAGRVRAGAGGVTCAVAGGNTGSGTAGLGVPGGPAGPEGAVAPVLVRAPDIDLTQWERDEEASDVLGTWRPRSGDAAWRVDVWRRRA